MSTTHLTLVVDRSGSMASIADDVIGGIRQLITEQKDGDGECVITYIQFDSEDPFEIVLDAVNVLNVQPGDIVFSPRAMTPLNDAIGKAVTHIRSRVSKLSDLGKPAEDQMLVIVTDGQENASKEFVGVDSVKDLISSVEADGWVAVFLAANIDAFATAGAYGFSKGATAMFDTNTQSVGASYSATSSVLTGLRQARSAGKTFDTTNAFAAVGIDNSKTLDEDSLDKAAS